MTQTGNQNTVRPVDCKPVSVRVFFFQSYDNGDAQLDSSELLKFIQQNESVAELQSYADQESNKLLRSVSVWICNMHSQRFLFLSIFNFPWHSLSLFASVEMFANPHPYVYAVLLFWDTWPYLTGTTFGQKRPDSEEIDKMFISTWTMLCSVYRADITVCVSVSLCFPGACVSMPSSSSLTRTQIGSWALMSFSTAWNLASIHQRRVSWAGRFSDFKEGRGNWNKPNQTLTQITRDWKLLTQCLWK